MNNVVKTIMILLVLIMALAIVHQARSQNVMLKVSSGGTLAVTLSDSVGDLPLPFIESWDQGNFTYHDWALSPAGNNWSIDSLNGNPPPCADFYRQPYR